MKEIVINTCYGGFSLSHEAIMRYAEIKGYTLYPVKGKFSFSTYWKVPENERVKELRGNWQSHSLEARQEYNKKYSEQTLYDREIPRDDPALVQVVKEMGERSFGGHAGCVASNIGTDTIKVSAVLAKLVTSPDTICPGIYFSLIDSSKTYFSLS